jgi:hypothetical protein
MITALSSSGLVVCLSRVLDSRSSEVAQATCVPSDSGSNEVVESRYPRGNPCNVRSLLSCNWLIWQNDSPKT